MSAMAKNLLLFASLSWGIPNLVGCTSSGFECGAPLASDPDQTYTCARPEEVCLCHTRSCARPEHPASDVKEPCESGLRYVSEPDFVSAPARVGACVDPAHASSKMSQLDSQARCDGSTPASESSTSSTGASETTPAEASTTSDLTTTADSSTSGASTGAMTSTTT